MAKNFKLYKPFVSSFLSCEKDTETILKRLFVDYKQESELLKRLLVINTKDCLDDLTNADYIAKINSMSVAKLKQDGYISLAPKIRFPEHEEIKSYIMLNFDGFTMNAENPQYRDCNVIFDIICHTDYWDLGDYRVRPLKICGYIDSLLNNSKLSGIGVLNFMGCNQIVLDENLSGYTLMYRAIHGSDDLIPRVND